MTSTVPAIWFLELHELDLRINHQVSTNNTTAFNETLEALSANLGSILGVSLVYIKKLFKISFASNL